MMTRKIFGLGLGVAMVSMMAGIAPASAAGHGIRFLNFAAFQKNDPKGKWDYDALVLGHFSSFITNMEAGSHILLLSHTADIKDGDVVNIQTDVLRADKGGKLGDSGINCQLSFQDNSTKDTTSFAVGGLCKILEITSDKDLSLKALIPPASVPDTAQGEDVWVQLYEDPKTGIAFYANVSGEEK
jgi:hypothetical protein